MRTLTYKTTNILSMALAIGVLLLGIGLEQTHAAESGEYDAKVYPGAICFFPKPLAPFAGLANGARDDGTLENPEITGAGTTPNVICPIVRDNMQTEGGLSQVKVNYENNHPHQSVACSVHTWRSLNRSNLADVVSETQFSKRIGRGEFRFYSPVPSHVWWSYYTVNCRLPGKHEGKVSRIISLVVKEKG